MRSRKRSYGVVKGEGGGERDAWGQGQSLRPVMQLILHKRGERRGGEVGGHKVHCCTH